MELLPPVELLHERTSIELLLEDINKHAAKQGYAVIKGRSKLSKVGVKMKYWIRCDRQGRAKLEGHGHRNTSSRRNECPFSCIAKLQGNIEDEHGLGAWTLTVVHAKHNHAPIKPAGCPTYRQKALKNPEVQTETEKDWRKGSKVNATLKGLRLDLEEPMFKPQDLWNANAVVKAAAMSSLTPTQTLMKYLTKSPSWYVDSKKKEYNDELEFLFFTPKCMQKLQRLYSKIPVMNCCRLALEAFELRVNRF